MKNTLMIVRGENSPLDERDMKRLYLFLKFVGGNYRNSIYIECHCNQGYLFTTDRDGKPLLISVNDFYHLTGEYPQKDEMYGSLDCRFFETLFRTWFTWNTDTNECPLCSMYNKQSEVFLHTNEKEK